MGAPACPHMLTVRVAHNVAGDSVGCVDVCDVEANSMFYVNGDGGAGGDDNVHVGECQM